MAENFQNLKDILSAKDIFSPENKEKFKFNVLDLNLDNIKTTPPKGVEGVSIVELPQDDRNIEVVNPSGRDSVIKSIVENRQAKTLQYPNIVSTGETLRAATPETTSEKKTGFSFPNLFSILPKPSDAEVREDARLSYLRGQEFAKTLDSMKDKVTQKKEYKEPESFGGQLLEGIKSGIPVLKATPGYVAEVVGRQTGSPELLKWGQKYGDKKIAELVLDETLARPKDMKEFVKGGFSDPRLYGRYIGETLPSIVSMLVSSTAAGLIAGPSGASVGAYASIYALEQANAYKSMIDSGVAPDKAGTASSIYATISTILENGLGYIPSKIGTKLSGRQVQKEVVDDFQKYLLKKLPELPAKILKKSAEEGIEEAAQGLTEDLINKYFDDNKEVLKNIPENFFAGAIGSLPFGATEITKQNIGELYEAAKNVQPGLSIKDVSLENQIKKYKEEGKSFDEWFEEEAPKQTDYQYEQKKEVLDFIKKNEDLNLDEITDALLEVGIDTSNLDEAKQLLESQIKETENIKTKPQLKQLWDSVGKSDNFAEKRTPETVIAQDRIEASDKKETIMLYRGVSDKSGSSGFYTGTHYTPDKNYAKTFGDLIKKKVTGRFFDLNDRELEDRLLRESGVTASGDKLSKILQENGYDGIKRGNEYIVFNNEKEEPEKERTPETVIAPEKIKAGDRINIINESINKTGRVENVKIGLMDEEGKIKNVPREESKVYVKMEDIKAPIEIKVGDPNTAIFREKKPQTKSLEAMGIKRPQARKITMAEDVLLRKKIREQARAVKQAAPSIRSQLKTKIINDINERRGRVDLVKGSIMELSKTIPLSERGKLLATMKNAKSFKDLEKARDFIENIGEEATRKNLVRAIVEMLKKTKVKKSFGKPVGKFTADVQKVLDIFAAASRMSNEDAQNIIDNNIEKYKDSIMPDEVALQNRILSMGSGILKKSNEELNALYNVIYKIKESGELTNALKKFNRQAEVDQWKNAAIDVITGGKGIKEGTETVGVQENYVKRPESWKEAFAAAKHQLETMGKTFVGWQDILDMLSSKDKGSKPFQSFLNKFGETLEEENEYSSKLKENTVELRKMFADSYGLKTDREIIDKMRDDTERVSLGVFENSEGETVNLEMSRAEARKRWMELKDPSLENAFKEGMFYTDEIIGAIDNFLTKKDKEFAEAQLDFYREYYKSINEIYRDIYGVDLPFNDFYSPIRRGDIQRDTGDIMGTFNRDIALRRSVSKGALKTRMANKKLIETRSDIQAIQAHVAEMEHFKAWANKIKDLNAVFGDPKVMTAIRQEYGKGMNSIVQNFLVDFARGGVEMASNFNIMDMIRIRFTQGVLALKPSIAVKQLVSFVAYADAIPVKDYIAGELDFWKSPIENYKFLSEKSKLLQARGENMERDIKSASNSDAYAAYRKKQSLLNSMMLNIKIGDQAAIVVGGWAVYKHQYNKSKAEGKTEAEAVNDGIRRFEIVTKTTQQSAALADLSAWQRNPITKLFTMFLSSPNQYLRKEMGAVRNLFTKRGDPVQHMKTILIFHFILPMFFQFVSDFGRWDEEEQKRAMILGSLNGLFIFGDGMEYLIRSALGMRKFDMEQPYMSVYDDLSKLTDLLADDDITMEDFMKATEGLIDATGKATGLPTGYVWDTAGSLNKLISGEYYQGLGQLAGWSEYSVEKKLGDKRVKPKVGGDFGGIDIGNIDLDNIDLGNIDLSSINLENIDLNNLDLDNLDLDNINLEDINL